MAHGPLVFFCSGTKIKKKKKNYLVLNMWVKISADNIEIFFLSSSEYRLLEFLCDILWKLSPKDN